MPESKSTASKLLRKLRSLHDPYEPSEPMSPLELIRILDEEKVLVDHEPHTIRYIRLHPKVSTQAPEGGSLHALKAFAVPPGENRTIRTGIAIELPSDYVAFLHPLRGYAAKHDVTVLNGAEMIDAEYRGELKVVLANHGNNTFIGEADQPIAQLVIQKFEPIHFELAEILSESVFSHLAPDQSGVPAS